MCAIAENEQRWMHPAVWVVLFFALPPVWLALIVLKYFKFVAVAAILFLAISTGMVMYALSADDVVAYYSVQELVKQEVR